MLAIQTVEVVCTIYTTQCPRSCWFCPNVDTQHSYSCLVLSLSFVKSLSGNQTELWIDTVWFWNITSAGKQKSLHVQYQSSTPRLPFPYRLSPPDRFHHVVGHVFGKPIVKFAPSAGKICFSGLKSKHDSKEALQATGFLIGFDGILCFWFWSTVHGRMQPVISRQIQLCFLQFMPSRK